MEASGRFRIVSSAFEAGFNDFRKLPTAPLPEAAFVGRSNVGKSSLLNALCGRRGLARTSKTPGRTQMLNYFRVEFAERRAAEEAVVARVPAYLVDLPGYGYAQVSKTHRAAWKQLLERYLGGRAQLAIVCLLIDVRRDPGEEERWIAELGAEGGLVVGLTKCDKVSKSERESRRRLMAKTLSLPVEHCVAISTLSGKRHGLAEITDLLASSLVMDPDDGDTDD
ncbi:MAG: ribosome biogenesis GTP-binding protein YsxC [Bdellovibrionales bacterium]|nr:ribosome biogenesis GTP-binding protein YsxC [Bdellovibrionales bacterium]